MELPNEAREILEEEEALLARVHESLRARRAEDPARERAELTERWKDLREQAAKAAAHDLPTLFQELALVRALLDREGAAALPDARSPYFAHLRLRENGRTRDFCLGRASLVDTSRDVRVVDWRWAPIARIFYRYREGDAFEEQFPGRLAEGVIDARRVVVVRDGKLVRIITPSLVLTRLPDGGWSAATASASLGGGAGSAARAGSLGVGWGATDRARQAEVSALLDREQFEALRESGSRPLLVLGSAGSGKTTVALHRLATLAYEEADRYPVARMLVVVPEPGLARLSERLLEPLGLGGVAVMTLDRWFRERMRGTFGAHLPSVRDDAPPLVARLKRHPALYHALRQQLLRSSGPATLRSARQKLGEWMTDRAFLASVVASAKGELPQTCIEEAARRTLFQLASPAEAVRDPDELDAVDGRALGEGTPEELAGTLDVEDLALLLFVKAFREGLPGERLAHLVVDEAEDIALAELFVLGRLLGDEHSVTLAGDEAQQTFSSFAGWDEALNALGAEGATTCRLQTTYRCPRPVAELARQILGPLAANSTPPQTGREGAPVGRFDFPSEAHANLFLVDAIRDLIDREADASVGVICRSGESAQAFHRLVADLPEARLVLDGTFTFQPGIDVTDVASVKGLEFDYVIIPDASASAYPANDESRRLLHVAVTRTSHQLWIASVGTASPILPRG